MTATRVEKIKYNSKLYILVRKDNNIILYDFYKAKSLILLNSKEKRVGGVARIRRSTFCKTVLLWSF